MSWTVPLIFFPECVRLVSSSMTSSFSMTCIQHRLLVCVTLILCLFLAYDLLEEFRLSKSRGVRRVDGSGPEAVAYRIIPSLHLKKSTRYLYPPTHIRLFHSFCFSIECNHVRPQTKSLMSCLCLSQSSTGVIWTIIVTSFKNMLLLTHRSTATHCPHTVHICLLTVICDSIW